MRVIEKFVKGNQSFERRTIKKSDYGERWQLNLCNYDNCNDFEWTGPISTTKKPSGSFMALPSVPLLMFLVLASVLTL